MKNVFKIALLNTLFFGFLQASSALAVEQRAYLATEAGETEIQFLAEAESVVLGLYYHPTPEEGTTGVGVVVNFDHTVFDASFVNLASNSLTAGATGDGEFRASYLNFSGSFDAGAEYPLLLGEFTFTRAERETAFEGDTDLTAEVYETAANSTAAAAETFTVKIPVTPPELTVPVAVMVEANGPGGADATLTDIVEFLEGATATDAVDGNLSVDVITDADTLSVFPLGTTTVTFSITDSDGGVDEATSTVTVVDTTAPDVSFGGELTLLLSADADGLPVTDSAIAGYLALFSGFDIVSSADLDITNNAPAVFPVESQTTVTLTATDAAGNGASLDVTIVVSDTEPPTFASTGPINLEANALGGLAYTREELITALGISDNVATLENITVVVTPAVAEVLPLGDTLFTVTATDTAEGENTQAVEVVVTVVDTTPPEISGADLTDLQALSPEPIPSSDARIQEWVATITAADIVDGPVALDETNIFLPIDFQIGDNPVTVSVADAAGNVTETTIFTVTVLGNDVAPVVTAPAGITVEANGPTGLTQEGADAALVEAMLEAASAQDDLEGAVEVFGDFVNAAGEVLDLEALPLGTTNVRFVAVDAFGNEGEAFSSVTVVDTTAPSITGPSLFEITVAAVDAAGTAANQLTDQFIAEYVATDIVDGDVTITNDAPAQFALGNTTVTLTATDAAGNTATQEITIRVVDQEAPMLLIGDIKLEATGPTGAPVTAETILAAVTATDNVDSEVFPQVGETLLDAYPLGTTLVQVIAEDAAGNERAMSAIIEVVDTTAPVISGANLQLLAPTPDAIIPVDDAEVLAWIDTITATDIVDEAVPVMVELSSGFGVGTTTLTFTAKDAAGNEASASFDIVVLSDLVAPVLTAPADITLEAEGPEGVTDTDVASEAVATFLAAAAALDDIDGDISSSITNDLAYPVALGDTTVTFEVSDVFGNTSTATATITVVDTTPPEIMGTLTGIFTATDENGASADRSDLEAFGNQITAKDIVDGDVEVIADVPDVFPVGVTEVAISASDAAGNSVSAVVVITIDDLTGPSLVTTAITVEAIGPNGAPVTELQILDSVKGTDNIDSVVFPELGAELPESFPVGTTLFPVSATDLSGNTGAAEIAINVVDTTAPVIVGVGLGITSSDDSATVPSSDERVQAWLDTVTATDLVDGAVSVLAEVPETLVGGANEVLFTAADSAGNEAARTLIITIAQDEEAPELTAPEPATVEAGGSDGVSEDDASAEDVKAFLASGSATDNIDGDISEAITNDLTFPVALGETTVTFTVADGFGNESTATSTISVVDTTPPTLSGPLTATLPAVDASGLPSADEAVAAYVASLTATDAVDGDLTVSIDLPVVLPLGGTKLVASATDAAGNKTAKTVEIVVADLTPPVLTVTPLTIEAKSASGTAVSNATLISSASAVDNVDIAPAIVVTDRLDLVLPIGTSEALISAIDAAGNQSSASVAVLVQDTTGPQFLNARNLGIQLLEEGTVPASSDEVQAWLQSISAADLVDGTVGVVSSALPEALPMGLTPVIFTATDAAGNQSSIELAINVFVGPKITVPANVTVVASDGVSATASEPAIAAFLDGASAVDTSGNAVDVTNDAPSSFAVGATVVTFSATDADGATSTETGTVTVIGASADSDLDGDGMDDLFEATYGLDPNDPSDAEGDLDGDGVSNLDEYFEGKDPSLDDVAPTITAPADITVNATGLFTKVDLGEAVASDAKDGDLTGTPSDNGPFAAGTHLIIWSVTDAAGNSAMDEQFVSINPRVTVSPKHRAAEGEVFKLGVVLNGRAAGYPLEVPFTVEGTATAGEDYVIDAEVVVFDERQGDGKKAELPITILTDADDNEGDETIIVTLGEPESGAVLGSVKSAEIVIVEEQVPPTLDLNSEQSGTPTRKVSTTAGRVTVMLDIVDVNGEHTVDWSQTDNNLVQLNAAGGMSFEFDPSALVAGVYKVTARVTDSGIPDADFGKTLSIKVEEDTVVVADTDNDGIPDDQDTSTEDNQLPVDSSSSEGTVSSEAGVKLVIGGAALSSGTPGVAVDESTIAESGEDGGEAPANGNDEDFDYPQGIYDFEVTQLPVPGQSVNVVIPLGEPMPAGAVYRKYTEATGWVEFVVDENNAVATAPGDGGACPDAGDEAYQPGLNEGDTCLQLTLEDGGPNDADGEVNGVMDDPGGIAVEAPVLVVNVPEDSTRKSVGGGCSVSQGPGDYGLLVLLALALLVAGRRRLQALARS